MAWIKMRESLLRSPKVITIAKILARSASFQEWAVPGYNDFDDPRTLSEAASQTVTCALLLKVWSTAREHGFFVGNDLVMPFISVGDVDQIAGVSGFGMAMFKVSWLDVTDGDDGGVVFPNFKEHNVPRSDSERAKEYRNRHKPSRTARDESTPEASRENSENVTPREEKRREENNKKKNPPHTPPQAGGRRRTRAEREHERREQEDAAERARVNGIVERQFREREQAEAERAKVLAQRSQEANGEA